jgi:hypothetical protein
MAERTRIAFGSESNIYHALYINKINAYDIICLDEKKIGWIDKDGNPVIVEGEQYVVPVEELPTVDGKSNVIYIHDNKGYIWNGTKCVPLSQETEVVTTLTQDVATLQEEMNTKVDEETVDAKIEAAVAEMSGFEIVEF